MRHTQHHDESTGLMTPTTPAQIPVAATIFRLAIVACAATGAALYIESVVSLRNFTQQTNVLVALYYTWALGYQAFRRGGEEPGSGGVRGVIVVAALTMAAIYLAMGGPLDTTRSLLAHAGTPLLVFLDWLFVGRQQARLRWWHPFAWLSYPVAYLVFVLTIGTMVPSTFAVWVAGRRWV